MSIIGTRPPLISETNLYELHHSSATYKIGLNQEIRFDNFKDILDTATESWYIYRGQN